ncbi:4-hydroxybenzoate octaprenyltransferase [Thiotrichales bacterium 19S11-10]|nr:4-hydroxybenzoate octaprenyltransferase [Thiotrichales bacterium 19S11-10]
MNQQIKAYMMLMRFHRPAPILLLLWPTYWALWIVNEGAPASDLLIIFTLGVILVRTLGCIINDLADRKYDYLVKRTENRPLTSGMIQPFNAWILFFILGLIAFMLVLFLNKLTIYLSFGALVLTVFYPFCKRFFVLPQLVLGMAYSYGVLMAASASINTIPFEIFLLYASAIIWTLAYDTIYAIADKPYDIKLGLKSSAVTFGRYDIVIIILLQQVFLLTLYFVGILEQFSAVYYISLVLSEVLFVLQYYQYRKRDIDSCINAFSSNNWVGLVIFIGILLQYS